jgi:hypothetical protein
VKDAPVPPEILRVLKEVTFVLRDFDGNTLGHRKGIPLTLVAMVMSMKYCINFRYADLAQ